MQEILCYYGGISDTSKHKAVDPVAIDLVLNGEDTVAISCRSCALQNEIPYSFSQGQVAIIQQSPTILTPHQIEMLKNLKPQTRSDEETDRKFEEVVAGQSFNFN